VALSTLCQEFVCVCLLLILAPTDKMSAILRKTVTEAKDLIAKVSLPCFDCGISVQMLIRLLE
jgi:hypothetical protein